MVSPYTELEYFYKLLKAYPIASEHAIITEGKGGANNTTRYIESMGHKYVIRVYETHQDIERVLVEHEILEELNNNKQLPLQVPKLIKAVNGRTALRFPDDSGRIAAISRYVEGINPSLDDDLTVYSFGVTTGLLMNTLSSIKINRAFAYKPYYEIEHTHPKCPPAFITEWCGHPPEPFQDLVFQLKQISEQLINFQKQVSWLRQLPHQIIHGDLNASNVLMNNDGIIHAVLDFEFATNDLRVMEVAVCISDLMVGEESESMKRDKLNTYMSGLNTIIQLNELEIEALPILVQLRRLDVFIHFLGRYIDGVDGVDMLRRQIVNAAKVKSD